MADSLILGKLIELLGGGVPSALPRCTGATFRLGTAFSLGDPVPVIDMVAALLGDGSRPSGWRMDNRPVTLPITISVPVTADSQADRLLLAGARETLLQIVTTDQFPLVWGPDGANGTRNLVFDCFKARATVTTWDLIANQQRISEVTVTFDAIPYGRSDALTDLIFDSPVLGTPAPPAPLTLDDYSLVSTSTQPTWWTQSPVTAAGSYSARWHHDITDMNSPLRYSHALSDAASYDFETDIDPWYVSENCTIAASTAQAHGGTGSLAMTSVAAGEMIASAEDVLACAPTDLITCTGWFRAGTAGRSCAPGAVFFDANYTYLTALYPTAAADNSSGWTQVTGTVTAPAGAAWCAPTVRVSGTGAAGEVHYADDVEISYGFTADLTGLSKLSFWFGLGTPYWTYGYWHWHQGNVSFVLTLTDADAHMLTFGLHQYCYSSDKPDWPLWQQITVNIPQGDPDFDYTALAAYSITAWSETHTWNNTTELDTTGYLAGLRAVPVTSPKRPASVRGGTYVLYGIEGTAPAELNVHCQLSPQTLVASTQTITLPGTPGTVNNFTAPGENPNSLSTGSADFEGGDTGTWTGSDGAATNAVLSSSTTQANGGSTSMRMTPSSGGSNMTAASCTAANITAQGITCTAGDRIAVRAYVRAGTTSRTVTLGVQFFTAAGAAISVVSLTGVADSNSAWTKLDGRVTAPATAAFGRAVLTVATPAAGEYHYIDDVYLAYAVQATVICVGGGGAAGSTWGYESAAGGGGGGEIAWETSLDLTPGGTHAYSIGAGGVAIWSGTWAPQGGQSYFTGMTTTVRGHGGGGGGNAAGAYESAPGAAAGTGSSNSHHYNGGTGAGGQYYNARGGGSGGSGGDGGAGGNAGTGSNNAPGTPGAAGSLGVGGGWGAWGYPGPAGHEGQGSNGGYPGGGGSGSASLSHAHHGGNGANGLIKVILTSYLVGERFPALIVHKPSQRSPLLAKPVLSVGDGGAVPDGREYMIDQVDQQNARYDGTYTVLLIAASLHGTTGRNVTVTIRQYESSGGDSSTVAASAYLGPAELVNGIINLGEVTLPVKEMPLENTDSYYSIAVTSDDTADRFLDVVLIDSQGSTFITSINGAGYTDYWYDAPSIDTGVPLVIGSVDDRSQAVSVMADTLISGRPIRVLPGDNTLTVYSPSGMPALEAEYWPHWWHERLW